MRKFISGVSEMVVKECRTVISIKEMVISKLMTHSQQIEEENLKDSARETKMAGIDSGDDSHSRFDGRGCSQFR